MSYIQLTSGATEIDIIRALASLPDGGTIVLPKSETIPITSGLNINVAQRDITLDLNGSTLLRAANVTVVTGRGQHPELEPVVLGQTSTGNVTLTYAETPAGIAPGSWIKVVSDDVLPGDHLDGNQPTRMGQAMQVSAVDGNTVSLNGTLIDQANYSTNVRATPYVSGTITIRNGEIVGDQNEAGRTAPLVQMRNTVEPHIESLTIRDASGKGIGIVDSVQAQISDALVKNLADSTGTLGIAVHSLSSSGTSVNGLYAENITHAADDNSVGNPENATDATYYGGDIGMNVENSVAYGARNFAWSWHSEAINGRFDNVMAFDSHGFLMARGIGGTMSDSGGAGNERGIVFYQWGNGDGRDITIENVTLKETIYYSTAAINDPRDNHIAGSYFESYSYTTPLDPRYATTADTAYVRANADAPDDIVAGTADSDILLGAKGNDLILGDEGNDYIWGGAGADSLDGGNGRDRFAFHDLSEAGDVIEDFQGGAFGDLIDLSVIKARLDWPTGDLFAGGFVRLQQNGADLHVLVDADGGQNNLALLTVLADTNVSSLGAANFQTSLSAGEPVGNVIGGSPGNDRLSGTAGDDFLSGGGGDDTLLAGEGNDRLQGGSGADVLSGSMGYDTADYAAETAGALADLADFSRNDGAAAGDYFSSIEHLSGTAFADALYGNQISNTLEGGAGADQLYGRSGNDNLRGGRGRDLIEGGAGKDVLTGGDGADTFRFASPSDGGDTIADFRATDKIAFSASGFGLGDATDFDLVLGVAPSASEAVPTILYDTASGQLWWDADGVAAQQPALLATLNNAPNIARSDFLIV